jgi:hypothetical protein
MSKRKKSLDCAAKATISQELGLSFREDFHALRSNEVDVILKWAKAAGYRKGPTAPGSRARMYYQLLQRTRSC